MAGAAVARGQEEMDAARRDPRRGVLVALMITLALAALDSSIVTTAVPSIVHSLGGFSLFPWLFSIYVLTQAVTIPVYGRLADLFGRKKILLFGIAVFLTGSVLCATSTTMVSLIVFRGLQGLGAGAIAPVVLTVVGDLYSVSERARIQGYTASVWGVAAVVGPLIGGSFTEYVSWRWIFYVNIPIGIAATVQLQRRLHESVGNRTQKIDYLGGITLTAGLVLVIFALLQGGATWSWQSPVELSILILGAFFTALFFVIERRVTDPMVPSWVVTRRPLVAGAVANIALGAYQIGLVSFIPTFVQGVTRHGPIVAGLTVATQTIGWPLASSYSGRIYLRFSFRATALVGAIVGVGGAALYSLVTAGTSLWIIALFGFIAGVAFGLVSTPVLVALQSLVDWNRRGIVTGANQFSRSLGSAVGVAVLGSVANSAMARWLEHPPKNVTGRLPHTVNAAARVLGAHHSDLNAAATAYVRLGLAHAAHDVFIGIGVAAVLMLVAVLCIPKQMTMLSLADEVGGGSEPAAKLAEVEGLA